jgi:hypothetical protein
MGEKKKSAYSFFLQTDIQVIGGVDSEPEHQNANGNGKHN